jgi:DNA polymerase I-like protein with 3'-5' exonuclease and polymerase domains
MFPNLTEEIIAIDIETKEEKDLQKYGPGSHRHYLQGEDSYILGVALSDSTNDYYFPASKELFDWLVSIVKEHLWVGHNVLYDLSWLYYEGFKPERVADTMGLVKLLAEDRQPRKGFAKPYSLDACAYDYLKFRKNEAEIKAFCEENKLRGNPQKWLWKMPFETVSRYAKIDTRLTYDLYIKLIPRILEQSLDKVWEIEKELLPILADTHHKGLRVDDKRRHEASGMLATEVNALKTWMVEKAGCDFNTGSGKQLAPIFDMLGLPYKTTEKGNPSFKGEDLLPYGVEPNMEYFPHVLVTHNKLQKLKRDFVDRLEDFMVEGRIHPMVNPYGTKTGRPTANTPNIFQIPKRGRGKEICRVLFIPEEGEEWASMDYASEEYRVFAHYAVGRGSDTYRYKYNTEDNYDMHIENARLAGVDRTKAKTIGLGVLFGMGKLKMAANLGEGEEKGLRIVNKFHEVNPSFRATSKLVENRAKRRGFIFTMLGRRRRLDRNSAYRGLNFLTQGNSADLAKKALVEAKKEGLLDKIGFRIWLYDEFNFSAATENRKYIERFKELAETAIEFRVKMALDLEYGPSWGEVK